MYDLILTNRIFSGPLSENSPRMRNWRFWVQPVVFWGMISIQPLTSRNIKVFKWISQAVQGVSRCLLSKYSIPMQMEYGIKDNRKKRTLTAYVMWLLLLVGSDITGLARPPYKHSYVLCEFWSFWWKSICGSGCSWSHIGLGAPQMLHHSFQTSVALDSQVFMSCWPACRLTAVWLLSAEFGRAEVQACSPCPLSLSSNWRRNSSHPKSLQIS